MSDEDKLDKIDQKLDLIRDDVNDIQGDVRVMSTLNKELNKEELKAEVYTKFGQSTAKRKIWYYADGTNSVSELAGLADIADATASRNCTKMSKSGILVEHDRGSSTYYKRAEVTEGIGIEQELEEEFDDL